MSKTLIKAGIIGCGKVAGLDNDQFNNTHAWAISKISGFRLISCYDDNEDKKNNFSNIFKCNPSKSIEDFLKEKLDIVAICTPDKTHFKIICKILNQKYDKPEIIFVEKPLCLNVKELIKLKKLQKNNKTKIIINHTRRFDKTHIKIKELIKNNYFGKLISGSGTYYGGLAHNGIHLIDILFYLFGKKIFLKKINGSKKSSINIDPSIQFTLEINKKTFNVYSVSDNLYQIFEYQFFFSEGRLMINDFGKEISFFKKKEDNFGRKKLIKKNMFSAMNDNSILNAYNLFKKYILKNDNSLLKDFDIYSTESSLKTIFDIQRKFKNEK